MEDVYKHIVDYILDLEIECPECAFVEDDQYTCPICWCTGGNGKINVVNFLTENPDMFNVTRDEYE